MCTCVCLHVDITSPDLAGVSLRIWICPSLAAGRLNGEGLVKGIKGKKSSLGTPLIAQISVLSCFFLHHGSQTIPFYIVVGH